MTENLRENLKAIAQMAVEQREPENALIVFERSLIEAQLKRRHWNQSDTAKALGIHRNTLFRRIGELGIVIPEEYRYLPKGKIQEAA